MITARQEQLVRLIRDLTAAQGYPPSLRELADHLGLRTPSTVYGMILSLKRKGYVGRVRYQPRTLSLTVKAQDYLRAKDLLTPAPGRR